MKREDFFYYFGNFLATSVPAILFALLVLIGALTGCSAPTPDASSANGQQQIIDQANQYLTNGDCADAVALLTPVYGSSNTDNAIRMAMASAYGCDATITYFGTIDSLITNSSQLENGLFAYLAAEYPSTLGKDYVVEGAEYGTDAVQATLNTGAVVLSQNEVNASSNNPGSLLVSDHTPDANIYLMLLSMAAIGGLENRYGSSNVLPWTTATAVDVNGCAYAASLLNFSDSLGAISNYVPTNLERTLSTIYSEFNQYFNEACSYGCSGQIPVDAILNPSNKWVASGCNTTCSTCPTTLRNRNSCTSSTTDVNSCAAAGLANFVNYSAAGW